MNFRILLLATCVVSSFCFAECKKKAVAKTELEKLPPATQTGANTFGCLINGQAYVPGGGGIFDNTLSVQYDPTFQGGNLSIRAKKIIDSTSIRVTLNGDSINTVGSYPLALRSPFNVVFSNQNCNFHTYYDAPISGELTFRSLKSQRE